jgi:hypothetical protein
MQCFFKICSNTQFSCYNVKCAHCKICSKIYVTRLIWFSEQVDLSSSSVSTSTLKLRITRCLSEWDLRWDLRVMKLLKEGNYIFSRRFHWLDWGDTCDKCFVRGLQVQWDNCWSGEHVNISMGRFWLEITEGAQDFWILWQNLIFICTWHWFL